MQYVSMCSNPPLALSLQCKIFLVANLMMFLNVIIIVQELSLFFVVGRRQKLSKTVGRRHFCQLKG